MMEDLIAKGLVLPPRSRKERRKQAMSDIEEICQLSGLVEEKQRDLRAALRGFHKQPAEALASPAWRRLTEKAHDDDGDRGAAVERAGEDSGDAGEPGEGGRAD